MKVVCYLAMLTLLLLFSCGRKDPVVAEAFHQKLYLSELQQMLPENLAAEDSVAVSTKIIDNWLTRQVVLNAAKREFSFSETAFKKELQEYRENLIIQAYFDRITADSTLFTVSDNDVRQYMKLYSYHYAVEREIVKLNYIRLSLNSNLIPKARNLFFDDNMRVSHKQQLIQLCSDSIEYYMDDDTWLYLDEISKELPVEFSDKMERNNKIQHFEVCDSTYCYLIVLLDYRTKHVKGDVNEEWEMARAMLVQQKKEDYINACKADLKKELK